MNRFILQSVKSTSTSVSSSQSLNKVITTVDTIILLILLRLKSPRNSLDETLEVGVAKVSALKLVQSPRLCTIKQLLTQCCNEGDKILPLSVVVRQLYE